MVCEVTVRCHIDDMILNLTKEQEEAVRSQKRWKSGGIID